MVVSVIVRKTQIIPDSSIQIFKYYITSKNTTGGGVCIKSQKKCYIIFEQP